MITAKLCIARILRLFAYQIWWVSRALFSRISLSDYKRIHGDCAKKPDYCTVGERRITKEGAMATTEFSRMGPAPRLYNDPDLSPLEFLHAVYHDPRLPMSIRIEAARGLLPYTEPRPASIPLSHIGCTIVIGGLGPSTPEPEPLQINEETQSFSLPASANHPAQSESQGPSNIETTSYPQSLPDYSTPPTPDEIQQIKAAVHALQPNFDPSQPIPLYLCGCGHWLAFPCDCATRTGH